MPEKGKKKKKEEGLDQMLKLDKKSVSALFALFLFFAFAKERNSSIPHGLEFAPFFRKKKTSTQKMSKTNSFLQTTRGKQAQHPLCTSVCMPG